MVELSYYVLSFDELESIVELRIVSFFTVIFELSEEFKELAFKSPTCYLDESSLDKMSEEELSSFSPCLSDESSFIV